MDGLQINRKRFLHFFKEQVLSFGYILLGPCLVVILFEVLRSSVFIELSKNDIRYLIDSYQNLKSSYYQNMLYCGFIFSYFFAFRLFLPHNMYKELVIPVSNMERLISNLTLTLVIIPLIYTFGFISIYIGNWVFIYSKHIEIINNNICILCFINKYLLFSILTLAVMYLLSSSIKLFLVLISSYLLLKILYEIYDFDLKASPFIFLEDYNQKLLFPILISITITGILVYYRTLKNRQIR